MNKFSYLYNFLCTGTSTPTTFSVDPFVIAIREMLVYELQQVVYYIERLKDLNIDMSEYSDKVIDFISVLIVNLDFNKESFFVIVEDLYKNKIKLEEMYISICEEKNIDMFLLSDDKKQLLSKEGIIKALNNPLKNISDYSEDKKVLNELMLNLVLNACNCLIELKNLGFDYTEAKNEVLKLFNISNSETVTLEDVISKIKNFAKCNYSIVRKLNEAVTQSYGPVELTSVSLSKVEGKCILVSGTSFLDLHKILEAVKDTNINVYTHHEMISAHEYEVLNSYKNLVGHFHLPYNNISLEFSDFPGPIYISQNSLPKVDFIRGRIYTSSRYPAYGILKIENDDFSEMIEYANLSEGFVENSTGNYVKIGYSFSDIEYKINDIVQKYNEGKIKHIFIIGLIDMFNFRNEYIKKFIDFVPDDCFVISFGEDSYKSNFWKVNSFFDFSVLYNIIETFFPKLDNFENNVSIFLSECNSSTISHIFNLIYLNVKNIFVGPCCPNMINPIVLDGLNTMFNIKTLDTPKNDIGLVLEQ